MRKDFAIIGLGAFGEGLCKLLSEQGADVVAMDIDEERVNAVADYVSYAYCCDSTKRSALEQLKLSEADCVIVAIGDKLESVILTIILLKELGVKHIIARSEDEGVKRVLLHLGVEDVIDTRELAVASLGYRLMSKSVVQYFELTKRHSVATLLYNHKEPSATLMELDLRNKYHLNVLLIHRGARDIIPAKTDRFEEGDSIVVFGDKTAIKRIDKTRI